MTEAPQILLQHHLKKLRLPTFQGEYAKQAQICAAENNEPPRVYRRAFCSNFRRLYQGRSCLHRKPPLLLVA